MSIHDTLIERLTLLVSDGPKAADVVLLQDGDYPGQYLLSLSDTGEQPGVVLTLADYDRYSATLCRLEVKVKTSVEFETTAIAYLEERASDLVERLSYMIEPLALVEVDRGDQIAQLRSQPIEKNEHTRTYWEALIYVHQTPRITLSRYQWQADNPDRTLIPYPTIFNNLGRLAEDMAACLQAD